MYIMQNAEERGLNAAKLALELITTTTRERERGARAPHNYSSNYA